MAETQVKKQVCGACGSDVRPNSLFCYHCGGQLDTEELSTDEPSDVWFRSEIAPVKENEPELETTVVTTEKSEQTEIVKEQIADEITEAEVQKEKTEPIEKPEELENENETKVNIKPKPFKERKKKKGYQKRSRSRKTESSKNTELKSAAALRKREKPSRLKKVEIVWEERTASPNIWFIIFALFLSLLVAVMVFFAFYLK